MRFHDKHMSADEVNNDFKSLCSDSPYEAEPAGPRDDDKAWDGLKLAQYAAAVDLPAEFLQSLGLETIADPWGKPRSVVAIPYRKRDGSLHRNRLRTAPRTSVGGVTHMVWDKRPAKTGACLYGLDVLPAQGCPVLLVESESDCHTLWYRGHDAVGCPGAGNYAPGRDDAELEDFDIIALADGDGALAKQLAKSRHLPRIRLAHLDGFNDVSDLHCRAPHRFDDVLATAIANAEPLEAVLARASGETEKAPLEVLLAVGEQARITDAALAMIQEDGLLYERGDTLVRLCGDRLIAVDEHWLADYFSRRITFYRMKEKEGTPERIPADPPVWLCKRINAKSGERGVPELAGILTQPTMRADGSLFDVPGYDPATGLLLRAGSWPKIPAHPQHPDFEAAWQTLWPPYSEFPYVSDDDRAVAVAAILTALVRRTLPLAPAFSFDAPVASSGKTLLAQCVAELSGTEPNIVPECEDGEIRKRLLSVLMDGTPAVLFDNIKGSFKSSALEVRNPAQTGHPF